MAWDTGHGGSDGSGPSHDVAQCSSYILDSASITTESVPWILDKVSWVRCEVVVFMTFMYDRR